MIGWSATLAFGQVAELDANLLGDGRGQYVLVGGIRVGGWLRSILLETKNRVAVTAFVFPKADAYADMSAQLFRTATATRRERCSSSGAASTAARAAAAASAGPGSCASQQLLIVQRRRGTAAARRWQQRQQQRRVDLGNGSGLCLVWPRPNSSGHGGCDSAAALC